MSGKGEPDPTWTLMFILGIIIGLVWLVWYIFRVEILEGLRYWRQLELLIASPFVDGMYPCFKWLRVAQVATGPTQLPSAEAIQWAGACFGTGSLRAMPPTAALDYYNITPTSMGFIADRLGAFWRWLMIFVCAGMAIYATYITPRNKFRTRHNLESFIRFQSTVWSVIAPIVHFNPAKHSARQPGERVPDRLPPFAEALSPEEWIAYCRIPVVNGIPDRDATRRAFQAQLGSRWRGLDNVPDHVRALFAAYALMGAQKREEADTILGDISACWSLEKGLVLSAKVRAEIEEALSDPEVGGKALDVAKNHAYRATALMGVLKWARFMGGVLAPAQFLWLRAVDRDLWYPLNNLGRRSFHSEGAGAIAHFMAEVNAKKALVVPRVDTAIVTLNQYMGRGGITIPSREEPTNKK